LTQAIAATVNNRKRAFSTPYLPPTYAAQLLTTSNSDNISNISGIGSNLNESLPGITTASFAGLEDSNVSNLYFYNKSSSGRSSFCVDEALWPAGLAKPGGGLQAVSDTNIYTNLALGDDRYRLPAEFSANTSPDASMIVQADQGNGGEDLEEAIDQFSPLLYPTGINQSRSMPIPISPSGSMTHSPTMIVPTGATNVKQSPITSPVHKIYDISPSSTAYTSFYSGSPDIQGSQLGTTVTKRISFSYDPAFGTSVNRLPLPLPQQQQQQQQQPLQQLMQDNTMQFSSPVQAAHKLSTASVESAPAAFLFATSPMSTSINRCTHIYSIHSKIFVPLFLPLAYLLNHKVYNKATFADALQNVSETIKSGPVTLTVP
uniref:Uncharacterized protein n=1 Tax=Glossina palpalis gambiensis TaxID=67801 RepID=A0A1B0AT43_9MUSC